MNTRKTKNRQVPTSGPPETVSSLDSHLGYWLRFVSNHVSQAFQSKMQDNGVTVSEWVIMREMFRTGYTSTTEISSNTGLTKSAVSKLIARLEEKALVIRLIAEEDQRNQVLFLSKSGKLLVPKLAILADQNDAEFFEFLSQSERESLLSVMRKIVMEKKLQVVPVD